MTNERVLLCLLSGRRLARRLVMSLPLLLLASVMNAAPLLDSKRMETTTVIPTRSSVASPLSSNVGLRAVDSLLAREARRRAAAHESSRLD